MSRKRSRKEDLDPLAPKPQHHRRKKVAIPSLPTVGKKQRGKNKKPKSELKPPTKKQINEMNRKLREDREAAAIQERREARELETNLDRVREIKVKLMRAPEPERGLHIGPSAVERLMRMIDECEGIEENENDRDERRMRVKALTETIVEGMAEISESLY